MENPELIKGSRYQRILPEPYFFEYRNDEAAQRARKDIEDNLYRFYPQKTLAEKLMKYNNTRLQYLLKLYYHLNSEQGIYFIYKSACKAYIIDNSRSGENFFYQTLWTNIQNFFITFHADFVSTLYCYWFFDRNSENISGASNFCSNYFKWLSKNLAEKGEVSFEEVREKLRSIL
jgi:hypothetical protein